MSNVNPKFFFKYSDWIITCAMLLFFVSLQLKFIAQRKHILKRKESVRLSEERTLVETVIRTTEQERKRFAEDLHDELGSNLAVLKMKVESLGKNEERFSPILKMIDKASDAVRHISHNLMPPYFSETPLQTLLNAHFIELNSAGKIHFSFFYTGADGQLTKDKELMIYRIIVELAHNCVKHSLASEVTIQLVCEDDTLEILCEDNGKGFHEMPNGKGLENVHSRVNYLSGTFTLDSNKNGTTIIIKIPLK